MKTLFTFVICVMLCGVVNAKGQKFGGVHNSHKNTSKSVHHSHTNTSKAVHNQHPTRKH